MLNRRGFITGVLGFVAAPAIVRATSLMPVRAFAAEFIGPGTLKYLELTREEVLYRELMDVTRQVFVPRLFDQIYRASPTFSYLMDNAA